jgi:hypothetical protein
MIRLCAQIPEGRLYTPPTHSHYIVTHVLPHVSPVLLLIVHNCDRGRVHVCPTTSLALQYSLHYTPPHLHARIPYMWTVPTIYCDYEFDFEANLRFLPTSLIPHMYCLYTYRVNRTSRVNPMFVSGELKSDYIDCVVRGSVMYACRCLVEDKKVCVRARVGVFDKVGVHVDGENVASYKHAQH